MVARGQIPDSIMGFDASGVLTLLGQDVMSLQPGDKVCRLAPGTYRMDFRKRQTSSKRFQMA